MTTNGVFPIHLAARSPQGMFMYEIHGKGDGNMMNLSREPSEETTSGMRFHGSRCMAFSNDGRYFAFCDGVATILMKHKSGVWTEHKKFALPRTSEIVFAPDGSSMATWEPYGMYVSQQNGPKSNDCINMRIYNCESGEEILSQVQKQQKNWAPQWAHGGLVVMTRSGSELLFVDSRNRQRMGKLVEPGVQSASISPGAPPYHIATFIIGNKGEPAKVHMAILDLEAFPKVLMKMFWKAESVQFKWNSKGTALLCTTSVEVDATNQSYYGEQQAYLLLTNGDSYKITLEKKGPVHSLDWHPNGNEFTVVYGYMPARATVFNLHAEMIYDFGEGARNEYNPSGNMLMLCGFGNLSGNVEFWTTYDEGKSTRRRLVQQMNAVNTTQFAWSSDGEHLVTATTAPRLRMDNSFRIWHYTGECIFEQLCGCNEVLWEVQFRPSLIRRHFEPVFVSAEQRRNAGLDARGKVQANGAAHPADGVVNKSGAYVPPHMREGANSQPTVTMQGLGPKPRPKPSVPEGSIVKPPKPSLSETEKRRIKLEKTLQQIEKLKARQQRGEVLEANQVTKIDTYDDVVRELASLAAS